MHRAGDIVYLKDWCEERDAWIPAVDHPPLVVVGIKPDEQQNLFGEPVPDKYLQVMDHTGKLRSMPAYFFMGIDEFDRVTNEISKTR
jgi:hypothetical protein